MSEEGKVSGDQWYPVVLLDDTDFKTGETGKVVGDLTVEYKKLGAGAGWSAYAPAAGDWQELGDGEYALNMGAGEFSSAGRWQVHVQCAGALTYRFSVEVRSFTLEELYTGANLVTFKLKSIDVVNATGDAVSFKATGNNDRGLYLEGFGSGPGLKAIGGATGPGIRADGGGANTNGIEAYGVDAGNGMQLNAGVTGNGLKVYGGGTSGAAIRAIGRAGNAEAMLLEGQGTAAGLHAIGGATGHGTKFQGGGTSGDGLHAIAGMAGCGIHAEGLGASTNGLRLISNEESAMYAKGHGDFHGIHAEGGTGQGCGIYAYGSNAGGAGIHAKGGSDAAGIKAEGADAGHGIHALSGTGATGDGIRAESQATNGNGLNTIKTGTGIDLKATDHGDGLWEDTSVALTAQEVRDAMKLAPTAGAPAAGSVDEHLDDILTDTVEIGVAGAGLTDLGGMSAGMQAEVEAECDDAITANASVIAIKAQTDLLPDGFKKNTAVAKFEFEMVQAADHITPALGAVITAQRSIDGGAYGPCTNAAAEVGLGTYTIDFSAADLNGDVITFKFSAAACDTRSITIKTNT